MFDDLAGDILESGEPLEKVLSQIESPEPEALCLRLIEISLLIEVQAYELYRIVADRSSNSDDRDVLYNLAQAEKAHMRILTKAIAECG